VSSSLAPLALGRRARLPRRGLLAAVLLAVAACEVVGRPGHERGFIWPVAGEIASGFGPKANGRFNDGVNIGAPEGTPVKATADGIVTYAGNELRGYGNLILIRHEGGWVSAYGHNERTLVVTGERVRKGQVIARVGRTGGVACPQLHFELRRGTTAVDPLTVLPAAALAPAASAPPVAVCEPTATGTSGS
jgi:murein DD-endopeptidase MepM/ murein hydrolase activator NlpD